MPASTAGGLAQPLSDLFDAVPPDWREVLEPFRTRPIGQALIARVDAARQGLTVYPADVFATRHTRRSQIKVVILGQDPYHGGPGPRPGLLGAPGQAIPPACATSAKSSRATSA